MVACFDNTYVQINFPEQEGAIFLIDEVGFCWLVVPSRRAPRHQSPRPALGGGRRRVRGRQRRGARDVLESSEKARDEQEEDDGQG